MKTCIVTYTNQDFIEKVRGTIFELRTIGNYDGDIVVIVGDDLKDNPPYLHDGVTVKYFPEIEREEYFQKLREKPITVGLDNPETNKPFLWHKLYTFHQYFKQWDKCLCLDGGMRIFKPIDKILNLDCKGKFLAHSDAYPTYEWRLYDQFDQVQFPEIYEDLQNEFDLNIDYFQTTMYMFNTNIIEDNTFDTLVELSKKYFTSKTSDQGLVNLYFNNKKYYNIWEQIKIKDDQTYYYDYFERPGRYYQDYIMLNRCHTGPGVRI